MPIALVIDGANRHDMKLVRSTLDSIMAVRPKPTVAMPQGICLDKGYDFEEVRELVREFSFTAHIRARGEEAKAIKQEAGFKARRWVVERHTTRKYGGLELPDLTELLTSVTLDDGRIALLKDGAIALVGVLGSAMSGELEEAAHIYTEVTLRGIPASANGRRSTYIVSRIKKARMPCAEIERIGLL